MPDDKSKTEPGAAVPAVPEPIATEEEFQRQATIALGEEVDIVKQFPFLQLRWASFIVYILDPFIPFQYPPKKISVANGWTIYDYGNYLVISRGAAWGDEVGDMGSSTGAMIVSAQAMILEAKWRGAVAVAFWGHRIAQFAAWMECIKWANIDVVNYLVDLDDLEKHDRILKLQSYGTEEWSKKGWPKPKP